MTRLLFTLVVASLVFAAGYVALFGLPGSRSGDPAAGVSFQRVEPPKPFGTIRGRCRLDRPVVRWRVPAPDCKGGGTMLTDSVAVTDDGDLGGCVVWLDDADRRSTSAVQSTVRLEIRADGFRPHVVAARAPVQVAVANTTACDFNVHGLRNFDPPVTRFNFPAAPGSLVADAEGARLTVSGEYIVQDDIHPTCRAYLRVFTQPWFDVTSHESRPGLEPGEYLLKDVPPGEHEVTIWHESMLRHELRQDGSVASYSYGPSWHSEPAKVRVVSGQTAVVDFKVPVRPEIPSAPDVYVPR